MSAGLLRCARNDELHRSRDAVASELSSRASNKAAKPSAFRTDLRQRLPAVVTGSLTICASSHDVSVRKKKEAERRKTLIRILCTLRYSSPLARGARPSAFHRGSDLRDSRIPKALHRARLRGCCACKRRVAPASTAPTSSGAPRTPVIVPAGMMPDAAREPR